MELMEFHANVSLFISWFRRLLAHSLKLIVIDEIFTQRRAKLIEKFKSEKGRI